MTPGSGAAQWAWLYARLVHLAWRYRLWNEPAELAFMRGHLAAGQAVRDGSVIVQ